MYLENKVIAWWSGGVTSAIICKLCIDMFGIENVRIIFIDTKNEDEDTYRFKTDCENWYGCKIETITNIGVRYESIQHVWNKYLSLNISKGASCSLRLKRYVREDWEKHNKWSYQAFGFDIKETQRAISMTLNQPHINAIYPLMLFGLTKKDCINMLKKEGLDLPITYKYGFQNNNCFKTGCIQGGIGYWQKMKRDFPEKFYTMAKVEHELTDKKGEPVTMLKDQSKNGGKVFLMSHAKYPEVKDISMMKGREPQPLTECNGFCGINDLAQRNSTENEINYEPILNSFEKTEERGQKIK